MPGKSAPVLKLTAEERYELEELLRKQKTPRGIAERAKIILLADDGVGYRETSRKLDITRIKVTMWRDRWLANPNIPINVRLKDHDRPGATPTFTPEQVCQIIALACEPPSKSNRPISHWTPKELANEAVKRKIVDTISASQVRRFLKGSRSKTTSTSTMVNGSRR